MNCQEAESRIHAAVDGELSAEHAIELEQHLVACPVCRACSNQYQAIDDGLAWLGESTETLGSAGFRASPAPAPQHSRWRWARGARFGIRAAAAVLVLAVGTVWFVQRSDRPGWVMDDLQPDGGTVLAGGEGPATARGSGRPTVMLRGRTRERFIAVPQETTQPKVHIVWLYPTLEQPGGKSSGARPGRSALASGASTPNEHKQTL